MHRATIVFSGRVQGVGFRWTTQRIANRHSVTGYVRNLADGRVELVLEGQESARNHVLSAVVEAMKSNIDGRHSTLSLATGEFEGFSIRH